MASDKLAARHFARGYVGSEQQRRQLASGRSGVAIYTAVTGGFEKTFKEPANCSGADFFAFTDGQALPTRNSSCWRVVGASQHVAPDPRSRGLPNSIETFRTNASIAKYYKINPHLLPELWPYQYVIWVDGTQFLRQSVASPAFAQAIGNTSTVTSFEHCTPTPPSRWERCRSGRVAYEIAQTKSVVHVLKNVPGGYHGQYATADFDAQTRYIFNQSGFREHWWRTAQDVANRSNLWDGRPQYGVWVTCLFIMNLANPDTLRLLDQWWIENANQTLQDQVTFSFAVWRTRVMPHSLPAHGVTGSYYSSSIHKKMPHHH